MRTTLILLIMLSIQTNGVAQPGKQDYKKATEVFKSRFYKSNDYPRFSKEINALDSQAYKFGDKYLEVDVENDDLHGLFLLGVFNPDIIFGETTTPLKTAEEIRALPENKRVFYNLMRNDSLRICCFESLEKLNPDFKTKRFIFWLFRKGLSNPVEYYIEFKNRNATKQTSLDEFIKEARMTFFYKGTIII